VGRRLVGPPRSTERSSRGERPRSPVTDATPDGVRDALRTLADGEDPGGDAATTPSASARSDETGDEHPQEGSTVRSRADQADGGDGCRDADDASRRDPSDEERTGSLPGGAGADGSVRNRSRTARGHGTEPSPRRVVETGLAALSSVRAAASFVAAGGAERLWRATDRADDARVERRARRTLATLARLRRAAGEGQERREGGRQGQGRGQGPEEGTPRRGATGAEACGDARNGGGDAFDGRGDARRNVPHRSEGAGRSDAADQFHRGHGTVLPRGAQRSRR
jgi:hypothetical protein